MFKGTDFDALKPDENADSQLLESFTFSHGYLCNCIFEYNIEIPICDNEQVVNGRLKAVLILGSPKENGALDKASLMGSILLTKTQIYKLKKVNVPYIYY